MSRRNDIEAAIEESWGQPDEEDIALMRHVMGLDDEPEQGLHRGGFKGIVEETFGVPTLEEDDNVHDYNYPWDDGVYGEDLAESYAELDAAVERGTIVFRGTGVDRHAVDVEAVVWDEREEPGGP